MDKPKMHPILEEALLRDKSKDIVYRKFGSTKKKTQEGNYFDVNGMVIKDPVRIFETNNMPKFSSMDEIHKFLLKVDYERWKYSEFDQEFIMHHYGMVKKMYIPKTKLQKMVKRYVERKKDLDIRLKSMKALFTRVHRIEMADLRKLHFELYGDI